MNNRQTTDFRAAIRHAFGICDETGTLNDNQPIRRCGVLSPRFILWMIVNEYEAYKEGCKTCKT